MLKRRLYINIASMTIASLLILSLLLVSIFYNFYVSKEKENLIVNGNLITSTIEYFDVDDTKYLNRIKNQDKNLRITLIDSNGEVKFDSVSDPMTMENHRDRSEVKSAFSKGTGEATRHSDTLSKSTYYYAVLLSNNSVVRVARQVDNILFVFLGIFPAIIGIILILLTFSFIMSSILTKKIVKPIEKATENIENIIAGNDIVKVDTYEEITPFIKALNLQSKKIHQHIKELKEAEKIRREFSANVSHELKTPLTSINGYAEMIASGIAKEEDAIKFAGIIRKEGIRLVNLIDTIIKLSELDESKENKDFEVTDIYEIAINVVKLLDFTAKDKDVSINVVGKSAIIIANKIMMEELLFNLIDNSIKYNKIGGSVDIYIDKHKNYTMIKVIDTGSGIPKEDQNRIFERFYRVDKSRSKKTSGSGLGLSIVKHIVEYHGGTISVMSEEGKGTEITVNIVNGDV